MSTYDLTGADPDFLRSDVRFAVFEANQRLFLNEPAFADSIEVVWLDGATNPVLVEGVQWRTTYEDRDYAAMSEAKLIDSGFSDILVKSLENLDIPASDRVYAVQYQALKLKPSEEDPGLYGPNPTPGLLSELITDVDFLKLVKNPLGDLTSDATDGIKALQEDVTGVNPANFIEDERHFVDVPNNKMIIRTSSGPFFAHDVVLTNVTTGLPLTEGTDYKFIGWNRSKQSIAEHTSQVYDYIMLLIPLVGNIDVTYHAFGGEATISDINAIKDVLAEITHTLTDGNLLSEDALPYTDIVIDIITRLNAVEDATRHYVSATHQYQANTDGLHWFTIANLYRDAWDTQTLEVGQMHLTLRSWTQNWSYDLLLSLDLKSDSKGLSVKTIDYADQTNSFEISRYDNLDDRRDLKLRVIWNDNAGTLSGAQIQVGLEMTALQTEVLSVYDRSGSGSDFVIRDHVVGTDTIYDDDVELPDGSTWTNPYRGSYATLVDLTSAIPTGQDGWYAWVYDSDVETSVGYYYWDGSTWALADAEVSAAYYPNGSYVEPPQEVIGLGIAKSAVRPITPTEGYLVWAGCLPLDSKTLDPYDSFLTLGWLLEPGDIKVEHIKEVNIFVYDRYRDTIVKGTQEVHFENKISQSYINKLRKYTTVMFYLEDLSALKLTLTQSALFVDGDAYANHLSINFDSIVGTNSETNERFDLRQITFGF